MQQDRRGPSGFTQSFFCRTGRLAACGAVLGVALALAGCGEEKKKTTTTTQGPRELKVMQWVHFVPQYDRWFDPFLAAWGATNDVTVSVEHVPLAELPGRIRAALDAGEGPDLIEAMSPPSAFEPQVLDLSDINQKMNGLYGQQLDVCTKSSFNPRTNVFYGFAHGWVPDPGNYRNSLWADAQVNMSNGPTTWQDLLDGGKLIKDNLGVPLGIGMVHEIDSNMGARALLWSFGASEQDANENVIINSQATKDAVQFMINLYNATMTAEVLDVSTWTAASNNNRLIAGQASYILNSISAYRTAQKTVPQTADDVFLLPPLKGPTGIGVASTHVIPIYVVPKYTKNADTAKAFLEHLVANYNNAVFNAELYNFPCWTSTTPQLTEGTNDWLDLDPFGSRPGSKLGLLKNATEWTKNVGYPGPANAAIGEVFDSYVLPDMLREAVTGEKTVDQAVADAETKIKTIFAKWRAAGLVGGTD